MDNASILVVDDDKGTRESLSEILNLDGYHTEIAENGQKAIKLLGEKEYDVILTDLKMPMADGLDVLKYVKRSNSITEVVIFTGFGTIKNAVEAMKAGAYDYILKPLQTEEMKIVIQKALEHKRLKAENILLRKQLKTKYKFENLLGNHEKMLEVFKLIETVADCNSTVLVYGESGTGKELVARAIHYNSNRQDRPLIPVNCGAIPEDLLESELFGHERGAFTGAIATRKGRFELASGGTIFLDEIGEMSPALQVKILRVLQEQEFERIGGSKSIRVDVRVIAATNKNLEEQVSNRTFREDLFYRLNVIPIDIPPLRVRTSDVPLLAYHFIEKFNKEKKRNIEEFSPECMQILMNYHWPGNVRELENLMERLVILKGKGTVVPEDLPEKLLAARQGSLVPKIEIPEAGICFKSLVSEFEKKLIIQALDKSNWIKNKAAKLLNLNRTTLVEKIKKIDIQ
ncbi:MAG TPA: sigma-54 dependent transcriptional regulator [Nitrospinota bacterium]|nr:sigma-54 dependent transcriptional regulator [Nitrospinota bacterium]